MKKILPLFLLTPFILFSQVNQVEYNITINNNPWEGNLFFHRGGNNPKAVKIINPQESELFSANWGMKGWDFKVNYNNKLSYFDRASKGFFIRDSLFNVVDSVYCQNGYTADNHDFLALRNGHYVLIAYDMQPYAMDTIINGGDPNAQVEGLIIQELDANHNVIFEWKSWDHFHVTDNIYLDLTSSTLPFIHANAIDIDFDGHFLISSRNLDEITKIHRTTGDVIWRFGGSQNDFIFVNDYPFTHQHSIQSLGNNKYVLFDNGNFSGQYYASGNNVSRAVEYELDTILMTATKTWEFIHPDSLYTPSIGSVQRLPNGNTLIDFGNLQYQQMGSIVTEVDQNNQIVFQLEYDNGGNLYRAKKFDWAFDPSIIGCDDQLACNYDPGAIIIDNNTCYYLLENTQITLLNTTLEATVNTGVPPYTYQWNTGEITESINISQNQDGTYWVIITDANNCISDTTFFHVNQTSIYHEIYNLEKTFLITDVLGKETIPKPNTILFYINKDGRTQKKIIIE